MKTRFIILIDFSDYSANQIRFARQWSESTDGEIILVHQTTPLIPTMTDEQSKQLIRENTNRAAREELIKLTIQTVGNTSGFGYLASEKDTEEILNDLTKQHEYNNILLVGLRGTNNTLRKLLMGSFALNIIENAKNIVVTLPKQTKHFEQSSIFVAVNKSYPVNLRQFEKLLSTFDKTKLSITFFSVIKNGENEIEAENHLNELYESFKNETIVNTLLIEGDNVQTEITDLLENRPNTLLVVQKGSRFLVDKLFRHFLINDLMHDGNIPLIILP